MEDTENTFAEEKYMHKVGVKLLSDIQLKNILPNYRNLFAKIDQCREAAQRDPDLQKDLRKYYQYNLMYDNVFSVLGKRGTGKTSVAFTLQKKIKRDEKHREYDVVLPLIIPEVIPESCTVLGWILAIVKERMGELEESICNLEQENRGEEYRSRYRYSQETGVRETLVTKLEKISQMFYAGSYNPSNEQSYYRAIDYSVKQSEDYYKFAKEIANLWDAWVERIKKEYALRHGKTEKNICPMIYFVFDDVDLAPEKITEILSVIIKYLSHPNIIVIITADERLFLEVIENQLDQKIGRLPGEWREYLNRSAEDKYEVWGREATVKNKESEDVVNQTAAMYLGKVLPPSTRYYLRLFHTAKQKERFYAEKGKTLGEMIVNRIDELAKAIGNQEGNFMVVNDMLINFYLKFFGNTSRQINNAYVAFNELVTGLKRIIANEKSDSGDKEEDIDELYQCCRYFLCVALISNHTLAKVVENADVFVDEVFQPEYNQWRLYINYSYLNEYVEDSVVTSGSEEENNAVKVEVATQLYSLFIFVENILLLMEGVFPEGITERRKIHAIPFMTKYIQHIAFDNRHMFREDLSANDFFEHYNNLLDRLISIVVNRQSTDMRFSLTYFYDFRNSKLSQNSKGQKNVKDSKSSKQGVPKMDLRTIVRRNPGWFQELVGMLTMVYGNAYLFDKSEMADCVAFRDKKYLVRYQQRICSMLQEYMNQCFYQIKLQDVWTKGKWKENLERAYDGQDRTNQGYDELVELVIDAAMKLMGAETGEVAVKADGEGNERRQLPTDLSLILKIVYQFLEPEKCIENPENIRELLYRCPNDISGEIGRGLKDIPSGRGTIRRMLSERIASVERIEYAWNNRGMLCEPNRTVEVFENLFRINNSRYEELRRIGAEISKNLTNNSGQNETVLVDKTLYRRMLTALGRALDKQDSGQYIDSEEDMLLYEARELPMELDIGVDLYNKEAMRRAVKLGVEVAWIGLLQAIYLYQTVYDRYTNNNSISSKELERVDGKNTYYFNFFNRVVEFMTDTAIPERDISIKEKINSAFIQERDKYVEHLIVRVRNE